MTRQSNEFDHQLIFMNYDIGGSIVFFVVRFSGCLWRNENIYEVSIFQRSCGVRWWCSVNSFSQIERRKRDDFLNCIDQVTLWRCFINFHCWPFHTTICLDKCDSLKCACLQVFDTCLLIFFNSYKYSCPLQLVCLITLFLLNVISPIF